MLDDLLGRTALKEEIAALEDERDRLEARLEAESERRAEAVTARQRAEERVNRLEDRIADLEGRLADREDDEGSGPTFRRRETLHGERLDRVLDRLESFEGGPESVLTASVEERAAEPLRELLGDRAGLVDRAAPCLVCADDAGMLAVALRPPVAPEPFVEWAAAPAVDRRWLRPTGRFAFALVRSDRFALGVYEGDERVDYEGFTSDVKSDHSKGGFSQGRFERRRDAQIDEHRDRCEAVLADVDADRLYVVGDRRVVGAFAADGDAAVVADATAAVDASGPPEEALADAFRDFWSVRLYGL